MTSPASLVDLKQQTPAVEPDPAVRGLVAGSVQSSAPGEGGESVPLVVRVTAGRLSATVLTGGAAIWLLHSTFWTYLLILGLPIWRHVDLLPIVDSAQDDRAVPETASADAEEEQAAAVLEARAATDRNREERR